MNAERVAFRERLGRRSDEGVERYLAIIAEGKGDDCEMGQMKYEEALAEAISRKLDVSDYLWKGT